MELGVPVTQNVSLPNPVSTRAYALLLADPHTPFICVSKVDEFNSSIFEAEHVVFVPPFAPPHVQVHGPVPETVEAIPVAQRFVSGAEEIVVQFVDPHVPCMIGRATLATHVGFAPPCNPLHVHVTEDPCAGNDMVSGDTVPVEHNVSKPKFSASAGYVFAAVPHTPSTGTIVSAATCTTTTVQDFFERGFPSSVLQLFLSMTVLVCSALTHVHQSHTCQSGWQVVI